MFRAIISLLIILSSTVEINAQNYQIAYRLSYWENPDKSANKDQEDFYLYVDKNHSEFSSVLKMKKDSVMKYNKDNIGSRKAAYDAIPKTKFDFFLINNYETTSTLFAQKYMKYIAYQQTAPVYDWKIMDSVKTIKGFTCRKAMLTLRGNTYEAWFTDEISVFDGLYFFQGLPGLILEVTCIERKYKFTFVGIEENDSPINYRNTSLHAVTDKRKKFLLLADDWEKNTFRNIFKTGDMKLADSTADSEAFIEQMQAQINEKKPKFKLEIF